MTRVLEKAEHGDEHLDDFQRIPKCQALHVVHAQRHAALGYKKKDEV